MRPDWPRKQKGMRPHAFLFALGIHQLINNLNYKLNQHSSFYRVFT